MSGLQDSDKPTVFIAGFCLLLDFIMIVAFLLDYFRKRNSNLSNKGAPVGGWRCELPFWTLGPWMRRLVDRASKIAIEELFFRTHDQ